MLAVIRRHDKRMDCGHNAVHGLTIGITNDESKTNAMMVRGDKFDAIKANPASLKGQRLLLTTNSTVDYAARKCLVKMGLAANDMQFVNLGQAQIITAEADAQAAGIYAESFNKDPDFYDFYRAMQSYRLTFGTDGTEATGTSNLILSPNNEYLREFRGRR